ncbi:MAG: hypothetical protein LUE86_10175 [Clostridiales bacterium]|nr:hypothetical protein [Clostridiales bacterium]
MVSNLGSPGCNSNDTSVLCTPIVVLGGNHMRFDELIALQEIRNGKKLADFHKEDYEWEDGEYFDLPTVLMVLAALTYNKENGYMEVPENEWSDRAAILAVSKNFKALNRIPDASKPKAIAAMIEASGKVTRKDLPQFLSILNEQPISVLQKCLKQSPDMERFLNEENRRAMPRKQEPGKQKMTPPAERMDTAPPSAFSIDFASDPEFSDPDEVTVDMFLSLPAAEQTKKRLDALLASDEDLPGNFIKRLSIPNRNAVFYTKTGDMEKAAFWKAKIIPYLGLDICKEIAFKHPEASIETKMYLSKEGVAAFWKRKRQTASKLAMTQFFLAFPETTLDVSMAYDIVLSCEVLEHAPSVLKSSEAARKYFNRNPADILRLPAYQTPGKLLACGVPLNKKNLNRIVDEDFREKVAVALNIPYIREMPETVVV